MLSYKYLKCGVGCIAGVGAVNLRRMMADDDDPSLARGDSAGLYQPLMNEDHPPATV